VLQGSDFDFVDKKSFQAADTIVAVDTASDHDMTYFDDEDHPLAPPPDDHEYGSGYPTDLPDSAGTL